jgi:hypothetical protein
MVQWTPLSEIKAPVLPGLSFNPSLSLSVAHQDGDVVLCLADVLVREREWGVRAAAAEALGTIGRAAALIADGQVR